MPTHLPHGLKQLFKKLTGLQGSLLPWTDPTAYELPTRKSADSKKPPKFINNFYNLDL